MQFLELRHFTMPFMAYAFSTLDGHFIVAWIAAKFEMILVLASMFFLAVEVPVFFILPSPTCFIRLDLASAYKLIANLAGNQES